MPYLRIATAELALRIGACRYALRLGELQGRTWSSPDGFCAVLDGHLALTSGSLPTDGELASALGIEQTTVGSWRVKGDEAALPNDMHLDLLADELRSRAKDDGPRPPSGTTLRRERSLVELCRRLRPRVGERGVQELADALINIANLVHEACEARDVRQDATKALVIAGSDAPLAKAIVPLVAGVAPSDSPWREVLHALINGWNGYLLGALEMNSVSNDRLEAALPPPFGLFLAASADDLMRRAGARDGGDPETEGHRAMDYRDFKAAARAYRRWVASDPTSAEAHLQLGVALGESGECEQAEVELRIAKELRPGWHLPTIGIGVVQHQRGDLKGALQTLQGAWEEGCRESYLFYRLADLHHELANRPEAFVFAIASLPGGPLNRATPVEIRKAVNVQDADPTMLELAAFCAFEFGVQLRDSGEGEAGEAHIGLGAWLAKEGLRRHRPGAHEAWQAGRYRRT